jgi:hypothetical protein
MSTSIIGTKFVLTKACPTYDTKPGMFAVIAKYDKNVVKNRMEAVVAVFGDEAVACARRGCASVNACSGKT